MSSFPNMAAHSAARAAGAKTFTHVCGKCGRSEEYEVLPLLHGYAEWCGPCCRQNDREVAEFERHDTKSREFAAAERGEVPSWRLP